MLLTSVLFAIAYLIFIAILHVGLSRYAMAYVQHDRDLKAISIVIPFRNEAGNLPMLFKALEALDYPANTFEVILVDDYSEDDGYEQAKKWKDNTSLQVRLLKSSERGKKEAQRMAIQHAQYDLIACTDADCLPGEDWLKRISATFQDDRVQLAFGPVLLQESDHNLQETEFLALIASTMSMLMLRFPVMGNAANMAFRKDAYLKSTQIMKQINSPSGDDVFLLHNLGKEKYSVGVITGLNASVFTKPLPSFNLFLQQRLRWASKARYISNAASFLTGTFVFSVNAFLLVSLFLAFTGFSSIQPFLILFASKFLLDAIFIYHAGKFFKESISLMAVLAQDLINVIYVPVIGLFAQVLPFYWKGRRY